MILFLLLLQLLGAADSASRQAGPAVAGTSHPALGCGADRAGAWCGCTRWMRSTSNSRAQLVAKQNQQHQQLQQKQEQDHQRLAQQNANDARKQQVEQQHQQQTQQMEQKHTQQQEHLQQRQQPANHGENKPK